MIYDITKAGAEYFKYQKRESYTYCSEVMSSSCFFGPEGSQNVQFEL
jgi:hypothetical protein